MSDMTHDVEPVEWVRAKIDAPDARFSQATARLVGDVLTVFDRRSLDPIGSYRFDEPPRVKRDGANRPVLAGRVDGYPLTVTPDCSCNKPTRRVEKVRR